MNFETENLNKRMLLLIFAVIGVCTIIPFTGFFPAAAENFSYSAIQVAPFMLLALTAYMSARYPGLKIFTVIWLLIIILLTAIASFGVGAMSLMPPEFFSGTAQNSDELTALSDEIELSTIFEIFLIFIGVCTASILSLAGQIRAVRVFLSGYIPIDPDSFVHKTALTVVFALALIPLVPLLVTGMPPYLSPVFLEISNGAEMVAEVISFDIFSLFWMILASLVIAGLYINRSFPEVLKRLGLAKPSKKEFFLAVFAGVFLVGVFFVIDHSITAAFEFFGWTVTDADSVNLLFSAYMTPAAAVVAAISAGFGEEIAVRGLLQPRFGIIIPSVLFASLHAFQYNWDGVLSVFIAGIIFALLRKHYNTTFSAVTHSVYDLVLFCAIMIGVGI